MDAHQFIPKREQHLYGSKRFRNASRRARNRSRGVCQYCGLQPATSAHHWAPPADSPSCREVQHGDLTGLCQACHTIVEDMRRLLLGGMEHEKLAQEFRQLCKVLIRGLPG